MEFLPYVAYECTWDEDIFLGQYNSKEEAVTALQIQKAKRIYDKMFAAANNTKYNYYWERYDGNGEKIDEGTLV